MPHSNAAPRHSDARTVRPSKLVPKLGRDIDYILAKALRKEPEERYRTVDEFGADLHTVIAKRPISARRRQWLYLATKYWFVGPPLFGFVGSLTNSVLERHLHNALPPAIIIGLMGGGVGLGVALSLILRIHRKGALK